jgi:thiamine-phosphate pyrophosphorylase
MDSREQQKIRRGIASRLTGLYVIADPALRPRGDILGAAHAALRGGACAIQWRDKHRDKGTQLPEIYELSKLCQQYNALFIINDHADLALACNADAIHIGQSDLPIAVARRILNPNQLIGNSNALLKEARESATQGADYIAVGAMYPTTTKNDTRPAGLETLREVRKHITKPIVAIGGITLDNVKEVVKAGADAICVASAVIAQTDPEKEARLLLNHIRAA